MINKPAQSFLKLLNSRSGTYNFQFHIWAFFFYKKYLPNMYGIPSKVRIKYGWLVIFGTLYKSTHVKLSEKS